jgi:hypothetical protein
MDTNICPWYLADIEELVVFTCNDLIPRRSFVSLRFWLLRPLQLSSEQTLIFLYYSAHALVVFVVVRAICRYSQVGAQDALEIIPVNLQPCRWIAH